jgi:hypothetical protein
MIEVITSKRTGYREKGPFLFVSLFLDNHIKKQLKANVSRQGSTMQ